MNDFINSHMTTPRQVYQRTMEQPNEYSQKERTIRSDQKHYSAQIEQKNKDEQTNLRMSVQPYLLSSRNNQQIQNAIPNQTRAVNHKKSSFITNSLYRNTEKQQTLLKTTNTSLSRVPLQPTYSNLYQQQSTAVSSTFLQNSNFNNNSQQLSQGGQISQSLTNSQISQMQLSKNTYVKNQNAISLGLQKTKSNFILYHQQTNDQSNLQYDMIQNYQDFQAPIDKEMSGLLQKQQSILYENKDKRKNSSNLNNPRQEDQRYNSVDSKIQNYHYQLNYEQAKQRFYNPAPLQKLHKKAEYIPENKGDQQVSMHDDQSTVTSMLQNSMIESVKIRERNAGSFQQDINRSRLTKRLLDLQEPQNIQEEDVELLMSSNDSLAYKQRHYIERSNSSQFERNSDIINKYKKYSCDIKQISPRSDNKNNNNNKIDMEIKDNNKIDCEIKDNNNHNNIEEFTVNQRPPSMTSINTQQLNRDWNVSKSPRMRKLSQATVSTDYKIAQAPTNETLQSIYNKDNNKNFVTLSPANVFSKYSHSHTSTQEQIDNLCPLQMRERRSSSTGNIQEQIPDEPEKTQILRTLFIVGNRAPVVKLSQINNRFQSNRDRYFIPSLLKSLKGEKDKLSVLYRQYFQKLYFNFRINPKLENKYLQITPVILPPLNNNNKKTIFFDLDETLIHCIDIFTDPAQYQQFTQSNMTVRNEMSTTSLNSESCNEQLCTIQCSPQESIQCLFSVRPYAKEILKELSKDFELILLTAARKIYADAILEKLDPERKLFSHRFYRECCIEFSIPNPVSMSSTKKTYLKDLRVFQNRRLENIILVDNSPLSYLNQMNNGIPILDYCNNNKNDDELLHLSSYLKTLLKVQDVRESIKQKFLLKQYRAFPTVENLQNYLITELDDVVKI